MVCDYLCCVNNPKPDIYIPNTGRSYDRPAGRAVRPAVKSNTGNFKFSIYKSYH